MKTKHIESREDIYSQMIANAKNQHVGDSILLELEEQKAFLSTKKLKTMVNWKHYQFALWYEIELA